MYVIYPYCSHYVLAWHPVLKLAQAYTQHMHTHTHTQTHTPHKHSHPHPHTHTHAYTQLPKLECSMYMNIGLSMATFDEDSASREESHEQ